MKNFLGILTKCKDEPYVYEFCKYYLSQGVDKIIILDDDSFDKSIYKDVEKLKQVEIIYTHHAHTEEAYCRWYKELKHQFEWLMNVDVDEFITTKKNINNTIRDELLTTFKDADCIKVPWVFMSFNSLEKNPESILKTNVYRWDHNKKHPHHQLKFKCRYYRIPVKCIFKAEKFERCIHHMPKNQIGEVSIISSIDAKHTNGSWEHNNLRENDIENGFLLCYHYRINSIEHALYKIKHSKYYAKYSLQDLIDFDYPEIKDETLKIKSDLMDRNHTQ